TLYVIKHMGWYIYLISVQIVKK
ncbi:hypothetical protein, partial [Plasmodium yoelii yoelii]